MTSFFPCASILQIKTLSDSVKLQNANAEMQNEDFGTMRKKETKKNIVIAAKHLSIAGTTMF